MKVLIADDDPVFRRLICDILKKQQYEILEAASGIEAIDLFFSSQDIQLCILDVMMPGCDGWEVLSEIRQQSEVPIMMLTALADEPNEIHGLLHGADEYIAKPFSYPVFVARVEALLRKAKKHALERIELGSLRIEQETRRVFVGRDPISLTNKEYRLLCYLVANRGLVLSRDTILNGVWGFDFEGDIRTIDAHIKMLRASLLTAGSYIRTIRGCGYLFEVNDENFHSN